MKKGINWKILIICFVVVIIAAFLGSLLTNVGAWYQSIKPSITPPDFIFPIVWSILFILIAFSIYFAFTKLMPYQKNLKTKIAVLFGINLLLNVFWSFLFFALQKPIFSFFELIILFLSILWIMFAVWKVSKTSYFLLTPYLLWVIFAGVLNYLIAF